MRCEPHGRDALAPAHLVHCGLRRHTNTGRPRGLGPRPENLVAEIRDQFNLGASLFQIDRRAIGAVVRGHDDNTLADLDAVLMEIAPRSVG